MTVNKRVKTLKMMSLHHSELKDIKKVGRFEEMFSLYLG